eukprot:2741297-Prorocentrum_lima.AAC.1
MHTIGAQEAGPASRFWRFLSPASLVELGLSSGAVQDKQRSMIAAKVVGLTQFDTLENMHSQ